MDNFEDLFKSNTTAEIEETEAETLTETETEQVEETEQETAETETVEQTVEEPAREEAKESLVPLAALQAEREKIRASKAEIERLAAQVRAFEDQQRTRETPDAFDDPQAFAEFVQRQIDERVAQQLAEREFTKSRAKAIEEHGEEYLVSLADWIDDYRRDIDPSVDAKAMASGDPVKFAIELKKRHDAYSEFSADPDSYVKRRALEMGLVTPVQQTVATVQPSTAKTPQGPKSIASTPSREGKNTTTQMSFLDAINNNG